MRNHAHPTTRTRAMTLVGTGALLTLASLAAIIHHADQGTPSLAPWLTLLLGGLLIYATTELDHDEDVIEPTTRPRSTPQGTPPPATPPTALEDHRQAS